jgi:hypothetical protein
VIAVERILWFDAVLAVVERYASYLGQRFARFGASIGE